MVSHIIGNYLVSQGFLTPEELAMVLKERPRTRAGLGLIAISEGLLTGEEVRSLMATAGSDRAFAGEVAAQGYLTEGQIKVLLRKQGSTYMSLAQTLENRGLMTIEQLESCMKERWPDFTQLEDLKSDDVNRIVPLFIPPEAANFVNAACVAVRTLNRSVDSGIYPLKAFITNRFEAVNAVIQFVEGESGYSFAMAGKGKELAMVASRYMHEQFEEVDDEVMDIIGEIIGMICGLQATELSQEGFILELQPPSFYETMQAISAEGMLVFPLVVKDNTFYLLINMNNLIRIE